MKKVLIFTNNDGGLYKFRKELIEALINRGDKVYISLPYGEFVEPLKAIGCKFIDTPIDRRGINPIKDIKLLRDYMKIIVSIKPDLIVTYTIKPNIYGGIACRLTNTPYFPNITGLGTSIQNPGLLQKISLFLYKMGLKSAECVFFQNQDNLNFMKNKGIRLKNVKVLPGSGVNMMTHPYREYLQENEKISFLTAGRLMKDKGTSELLACARYIHTKYPNITFDLAGGFDEEAYKSQINELESEGVVKYLGWRTDILDLMASHHAIIHPSYHEGMSNTLLDAAAIGRPVIASDVPGCRETFDEGVSGFGIPIKNTEALINAVERFINLSHEEKEEMGRAARRKVINEFDRNIVINMYMNEINNILEEEKYELI